MERVGFPRRGGAQGGIFFEHGRPVTGKYIEDLLQDFALSQRELARSLRVHYVWVGRLLRRRYNRPLRSETARMFVNYRRGLTSKLTVPAQARAAGLVRHGFIKGERRSRYLLVSEVRDIREHYYPLLHEVLPQLPNAEPAEMFRWTLARARRETATPSAPMKFRHLLYWWLPLRAWLERDTDVLARVKPSEAVRDFLAFTFQSTRLSIQECLSGTLQPIEPERAREKAAAGRSKAGRHQGWSTEKKEFIKIGRAVEEVIPRFGELIAQVRGLPAHVRANRRLVNDHLRKMGFSSAEIEAGISAREPKIAARWFIAVQTGKSRDLIKEYHNDFRRDSSLVVSPVQPGEKIPEQLISPG